MNVEPVTVLLFVLMRTRIAGMGLKIGKCLMIWLGRLWKKVIERMFNMDKAECAYRLSVQLMKMQSHFPLEESPLNSIRSELYYKAGDLRKSDDRGIGLNHELEILEEEVKKADSEVDYDLIKFLEDWQLLDKFVSLNLDEHFVLFELR
jgi:hypothetical protein